MRVRTPAAPSSPLRFLWPSLGLPCSLPLRSSPTGVDADQLEVRPRQSAKKRKLHVKKLRATWRLHQLGQKRSLRQVHATASSAQPSRSVITTLAHLCRVQSGLRNKVTMVNPKTSTPDSRIRRSTRSLSCRTTTPCLRDRRGAACDASRNTVVNTLAQPTTACQDPAPSDQRGRRGRDARA